MVLESIISPSVAKKKPLEVFFFGVFTATVGLFLSYWVFRQYSSLTMVFLITLASVPLFYFTIKSEEKIDITFLSERRIMKEHFHVFLFLMLLFFGITFSLAVWYVLLPHEMVSILFSSQSQTILEINNKITGDVTAISLLTRIFLNNVRVLVFSILFAFLYGVGALFILTWNAAVIATAIGNFVRINLAEYAKIVGLHKLGIYFHVFSFGILKYAVHGIPEILAYFVGGLAGGIISMAVIKKDLFNENHEKIMFDTAELVILAVVLLLFAAMLEVFVTPLLF